MILPVLKTVHLNNYLILHADNYYSFFESINFKLAWFRISVIENAEYSFHKDIEELFGFSAARNE